MTTLVSKPQFDHEISLPGKNVTLKDGMMFRGTFHDGAQYFASVKYADERVAVADVISHIGLSPFRKGQRLRYNFSR